MKILITGGTGMIGSSLTNFLIQRGHNVVHVSRSAGNGNIRTYQWDVNARKMDESALANVDAVVHLAGAGVADKPWSEARKSELLTSRVETAGLLYEYVKTYGESVKVVVSASGTGYYGTDHDERFFSESDPPGSDFLANLTQAWESSIARFNALGKRVVTYRIGMVLNKDGGALKEFVRPVKWYVGAPLGTGDQYISWIHQQDLNRLFLNAIEEGAMQGVYNAVTPYPVTNREMMEGVAHALNKPIWLPPVPAFALKLLLGQMASLVLEGNRVSPEKLLQTGFTFLFDKLPDALGDIFALPHR